MEDRFTIRQICDSCGISRSTILRLEERGLLQPVHINEETGYRYYSTDNVMRILHIKMFLDMGLSYDDVALYFQSGGKSPALLDSLRDRLRLLQDTYHEIELRVNDKGDLRSEVLRLPEYVCFQREFSASDYRGKYRNSYETAREALERGYRPMVSQHLFIINKQSEPREEGGKNADCDYLCCVPLMPDCADEHTVFYPSCTAFSMLCYGGYSAIEKAHVEFGRQVRQLGLKPTGYPRGIAIVSGYTDAAFPPENYVSRLVLPIEDMTDKEMEELNQTLCPTEG